MRPELACRTALARGLRVGLFGGSFNPPACRASGGSLFALKRLQLDHIWWLVTPGNPLKDTRGLPPLAARLAAAERIARHPRIHVTGIEASFAPAIPPIPSPR